MERRDVFVGRWLFGILVCLTGLIIVLSVANIVLVLRHDSDVRIEDDGYCEELERVGSSCDEDEQNELVENQIMERIDKVEDEVYGLINRTPVDVEAINKLYDDAIDFVLQLDRKDYVIAISDNRTTAFLSKGLKKEALEALQTIDYSIFSGPDQYRAYSVMIELANELSDSDMVAKYQQMRDAVADEYWADYRATESVVEKSKKSKELLKEEETEEEEEEELLDIAEEELILEDD